MTTKQQLKKELKESLEYEYEQSIARKYMRNFVPIVFEGYDMQHFHETVCNYLDKLSIREIRKLMIFMPPQHGKSLLSSINFPAKLLGNDPTEKIIIGSYNKTKASEFLIKAKKVIKSPSYQELFPNTVIDGKDTDVYFETNNGNGFVKAAGMDSGVTGSDATCLILDDLFKGRNEANSITIRNRVWNTYNDDFLTRISDDRGIILKLFTRWHEDDSAGRLLEIESPYYDEEEASEWTVIIFQGLKEANSPKYSTVKVDDPRKVGEALWQVKHGKKKLEKRKRMRPTSFYSLIQQVPTAPEGDMIKREYFTILKPNQLPFNIKDVAWNLCIDGAWTKKETDKRKKQNDPDETGVACYHYDETNRHLYFRNVTGVQKEPSSLLLFLDEYAHQMGIDFKSKVYIEMKASGFFLKPYLHKLGINTARIPNRLVALGKFNRVELSEPSLTAGRIFLIQETGSNWIESFLSQCASYPNGAHDDKVDVFCYPTLIHLSRKRKRARMR